MKCNYCNKKAICNYQDVIMRYNIDKKGNFDNGEVNETLGDTNEFLCEKHEDDFLNNKL